MTIRGRRPAGNRDGEAVEETGAAAKRRLDLDMIVQAALRFIDQHGTQGLTMRGLGQHLGVEAMALYRYVTGRDELLEAVVNWLLEGLRNDLNAQLSETWQAYLQTLAHAVRRIAVEHAEAFPLVATRHPAAPWLRPPLRSLELVEDFLSTLSEHGFTDRQVVDAYHSFSSFLLGQLLPESAIRGADPSPVKLASGEGDAKIPNEDNQIDLTGNPSVARLRRLLSEDRSQEEFELSLETLLDRLELNLSH